MTETELDARIKALAEAVVDELNRDPDTTDAPVMLTTYALVVEGNGWSSDGERVTRGYRDYHGSLTQTKGLLLDCLDDLRSQDLSL